MGKTSSAVYNINYHIVWCPKYRKKILTGEIKEFLEDVIHTIAYSHGWTIKELKIMPNHIHLIIEAQPFISPTDIVKIIKGTTTKMVFKRFPELKKKEFWRSGLWSPSYYVGTLGDTSLEVALKYLEKQEKKHKVNNSTG